MVGLVILLYIAFGWVTVALVSIVARYMENRGMGSFELVMTFVFWPYFLVALIVRLNNEE